MNPLNFSSGECQAEYDITEMSLNEQKFNGCRSKNFLKANEEIITADKLFKSFFQKPAANVLSEQAPSSLEGRIDFFVSEIEKLIGIPNYGEYLTKMLEWDEFVLNDDRHFNNIAFTYNSNSKQFSICTLFDNGAAFLSDTRFDHPLQKDIYGMAASTKAKPFHSKFAKQTEACRKLYGTQLCILDNIQITKDVEQKIRSLYGDKVTDRVCDLFSHQKYLFSEYLYHQKTPVLDSLIAEAENAAIQRKTKHTISSPELNRQ